jgi:cobalt-zinc-cadmium efflux system protein
MAHDHSHHGHHHHHHHHNGGSKKNIVIAFWLNLGFAIFELVGGFYTNSVAILSDALHDFGDSLSLGLAYYFQQKSQQKQDIHFSYGYKRFSLLGAFINSLVLIVSSIFIIRESVLRLFDPEQPDAGGMIFLALAGILVNGFAMLRLQQGSSLNEKAIALHLMEDVLGWVAVLIGSVVMYFTTAPLLDPILSLLISGYILWNVFKNLKITFRILLQGTPININQSEIRKKVLSIAGVKDIHDVHFWTMDGQYNIMTLHVVVRDDTTASEMEKLKGEVKHCLQHLDMEHITVEMELENTACSQVNS